METNFEQIERQHSALARERVFADLRALADDAEDLLKATAHDASDKAKEARSRLAAAIDRAKANCERMQQQTADAGREAVRKADMAIRTHPYESLGIAFSAGLLIGALVARK